MGDSMFYDNEEHDENDELEEGSEFESDPSMLAFLDQEGAEFQAQREQFAAMYGFDHDCHCAQDYAEGKLAQVTQCYLALTDDALETAARLNWENQTLQGMVNTMVSMNDSLMSALEEAGLGINPDEVLKEALLDTFEDDGGRVVDAQADNSNNASLESETIEGNNDSELSGGDESD